MTERHGSEQHCSRCEREFEFAEICYGVSLEAQQFNSDRTVSVLRSDWEFLVCADCAREVVSHTIEQPFAELLRHFS